jgi:hypothetical protein
MIGRIQRPGRNDPCPCGSGKKFKRCCLNKDFGDLTPKELSLKQRNLLFVEMVADILNLKHLGDWDRISRDLSDDHVREVYKAVEFLWPIDTVNLTNF